MKKLLCFLGAGVLLASLTGCAKVEARIAIRQANENYSAEKYSEALKYYEDARQLDPSFDDLDRMIGYCNVGLYEPGNDKPENNKFADAAVEELQKYLKKRPKDEVAREALINLFLNAERTTQAIDYFKEYLKENPADLNAVRSVATLYAKSGDFNESLNWYKKITLLDSKNPEAYYTYGVVCYEKVAKNPPEDMAERINIIEMGKASLIEATRLREKYFEALVYINLMYREHAKIELDPTKQAALLAEADTYRNQAIEIARAKKAAEKAASEAPAK